jgi:hypothetical protein
MITAQHDLLSTGNYVRVYDKATEHIQVQFLVYLHHEGCNSYFPPLFLGVQTYAKPKRVAEKQSSISANKTGF